MVTVITVLIVLAALGVVLAPLLRSDGSAPTGQSWERERLEGLLSRRDSAYDALRDLDFEYQIGNLSESDYNELRERYRLRAASVLRRLDRLGPQPEQPPAPVAGAGAGHPAAEPVKDGVCPVCAQPREAEDAFCRHCGARQR